MPSDMSDSFSLVGKCAEDGGTCKIKYREKGYYIIIFLND